MEGGLKGVSGGGDFKGGWNVVLRDMREILIEGWSKWRMSQAKLGEEKGIDLGIE